MLYQRNLENSKALVLDELAVAKAIIPTPKKINYPTANAVVDIRQGISIDFGNVEPVKVHNIVVVRIARSLALVECMFAFFLLKDSNWKYLFYLTKATIVWIRGSNSVTFFSSCEFFS